MADKYIEMLKERDKERPLKKLLWAVGAKPLPACPNCEEILYTSRGHFCPMCGQRVDMTNWDI